MITFYLNRFSNHAREVRDQFLLLTLLLIPTYTLSLSNHDLNQVSQAVFIPCLTTDQGSSREATTALQFAELAFMKDRA